MMQVGECARVSFYLLCMWMCVCVWMLMLEYVECMSQDRAVIMQVCKQIVCVYMCNPKCDPVCVYVCVRVLV